MHVPFEPRLRAAALAACGLACAGEAPAPERPPEPRADELARAPAAELSGKEGDVRWQTPAADVWVPAPVGQALHVGDQVQTMEDARASVRLQGAPADIELAPESVLRIPAQEEVRRVRHVSGRLRARLDPAGGTTRLEVRLPPGDLVLEAQPGDDIVESRIEVGAERTDVAMLRGRGVLRRRAAPRVVIEDGDYARLEAGGTLVDRGLDLPAPVVHPPPAFVRTRGAVELAWEPVPGAAGVRATFDPAGAGEALTRDAEGSPGAFRVPSGTYDVSLRALTASGRTGRPSEPVTLRVEVDRTPPPLTLEVPRSGSVVDGPTVPLAGTTDPEASLTVDGHGIAVDASGAFRTERPLPRGVSNLVIRARDDVGNVRVVTRQVVRSR
ncbi:MAG: hypothetical protein AAF447_12880 [Myxococcota bacterium]